MNEEHSEMMQEYIEFMDKLQHMDGKSMNFGDWYMYAHGRKFGPSFEMFDAEYEYEYIKYCDFNKCKPNWEGRE